MKFYAVLFDLSEGYITRYLNKNNARRMLHPPTTK